MKSKIYIPIILVVIVALTLNLVLVNVGDSGTGAADKIDYTSKACLSLNGEALGCYGNVLTNCGKEQIKACLGQGACAAATQIALCNTSGAGDATDDNCEPTSVWKNFTVEYAACGLARAAGNFDNISDAGAGDVAGNYSVWATFTASCNNLVVNATAIMNGTDEKANCSLAIVGFPNVTLQTNDQLTVNWSISSS